MAETLSTVVVDWVSVHTNETGEMRIVDLELGKRLGFAKPYDIRVLIERNMAELESYGDIPCRVEKSQKQVGRPSSAYLLNEEQCLLVSMLARTPTAADVRKMLIAVFKKAKAACLKDDFLGQRILAYEDRRAWERLWGPGVVSSICELYGWPKSCEDGRMYAPLASVFQSLYVLLLGKEVVAELEKRNPSPRFGNNHHQLLAERVRAVVGNDVELIGILARQSGSPEEWKKRLRAHFLRQPLQLPLAVGQ